VTLERSFCQSFSRKMCCILFSIFSFGVKGIKKIKIKNLKVFCLFQIPRAFFPRRRWCWWTSVIMTCCCPLWLCPNPYTDKKSVKNVRFSILCKTLLGLKFGSCIFTDRSHLFVRVTQPEMKRSLGWTWTWCFEY
jgi:hypothetical protein